jgi:hypothetical protein
MREYYSSIGISKWKMELRYFVVAHQVIFCEGSTDPTGSDTFRI